MKSRKSSQQTPSGLQAVPARTAGSHFFWLLLIVIMGFVIAGVLATRRAFQNPRHAHVDKAPINSGPSFEVTPSSGDTAWDPSWPELPQTGKPARPIEVVRAAYAYAVRREDVLKYMPCYCGCERQGHHSNHDCFVRSKTEAGVPEWDPMGYT